MEKNQGGHHADKHSGLWTCWGACKANVCVLGNRVQTALKVSGNRVDVLVNNAGESLPGAC